MNKNTVSKFDLNDAFKALDDIDCPKAESFRDLSVRKKLEESKRSVRPTMSALFEEFYDVNNPEEMSKAKSDREADVAQAKLDKIQKIVDIDADNEDSLLNSYAGRIIIQCPQCQTLFYKKQEDIIASEEDPNIVNVGEVCQHCGNHDGYEIIGKVAEIDNTPAEQTAETEPADNELNLDFENPDNTEEATVDAETTEDANVGEVSEADLDNAMDNADTDLGEASIDLSDLDLNDENKDEEDEKKKESLQTADKTTLTESENKSDADEMKELNKKLEEHSEYIKFIQDQLACQKKALEDAIKAKASDEIQTAIQKQIDLLEQDLIEAVPDSIKNDLAGEPTEDIPTEDDAITDEPTNEEEPDIVAEDAPVEESLDEGIVDKLKNLKQDIKNGASFVKNKVTDAVKSNVNIGDQMDTKNKNGYLVIAGLDANGTFEPQTQFDKSVIKCNTFNDAVAAAEQQNKVFKDYTSKIFAIPDGTKITESKYTRRGQALTEATISLSNANSIKKGLGELTDLRDYKNGRMTKDNVGTLLRKGYQQARDDKAMEQGNRALDNMTKPRASFGGNGGADTANTEPAKPSNQEPQEPVTDATQTTPKQDSQSAPASTDAPAVETAKPATPEQASAETPEQVEQNQAETSAAASRSEKAKQTREANKAAFNTSIENITKNIPNGIVLKYEPKTPQYYSADQLQQAIKDGGNLSKGIKDTDIAIYAADGNKAATGNPIITIKNNKIVFANATAKESLNEAFDLDEMLTEEVNKDCDSNCDKTEGCDGKNCESKTEALVDSMDSVTDIDEVSANEYIEGFLKEVYSNVNNFKLTGCQFEEGANKLVLEGLITFASGKSKATNFIFEAKKRLESGKIVLTGINETFNDKTAFAIKANIKEGKLFTEGFKYKYKINEALIKGEIKK